MCGILGMVLPAGEAIDAALLGVLTDTMSHRGPDAADRLVHANVGLGHRRLSIIDTSAAGNQPMTNEDGSVAVVFNGAIYNFHELRRDLLARGHTFRSRSDTEVLVHGWEEYGPPLVTMLRGMFGLAIYDRQARRMLLARDRIGKKPLHWVRTAHGFAFASEIKALLGFPGVSRELDPRAVGEYMAYSYIAGERTIFRQIRRLPPGCTMTVATDAAVPEPRVERYWRLEPRPDESLAVGPWLEELDHTLKEAVRLRLESDVPLGAFLSGGIDSSLITAYMSQLDPGNVSTFCIGFNEEDWDESPHAAAVAEHLGTEHHTDTVSPDAVAVLPRLVEAYDEPFADPSAIPTYYVCQLMRGHVTVALSGDGGDELFLGYRRYAQTLALHQLGLLITPLGRLAARSASRALPTGSYLGRAMSRVSLRGFDLYHHALGFSEVFLSLLTPEGLDALGLPADQKAAADFHRVPGLSLLQRCQYMDIHHSLPDQMLVKVDRAAMCHSLEVRSPLLDQEVVELAARMPAEAQISRREQKLLLRRLAYRHVPRRLLDRPKRGFDVPLGRWFRGELAPLAREMLADAGSPMWSCFDRAEAQRRFDDHLARRSDSEKVLWRLLFFHAWADRFLR